VIASPSSIWQNALWQSSQCEHKNNENNLSLVSGEAPGAIKLVSCWQALPCRSFQHSEKPIESRHGNITGTNTHRACPVRQLFAFHTDVSLGHWECSLSKPNLHNLNCGPHTADDWTLFRTWIQNALTVAVVHLWGWRGCNMYSDYARGWVEWISNPSQRKFSFLQTRPYFVAYAATTSMAGSALSRRKAAGVWRWPLNSIYRRCWDWVQL